jgi:hypothetical protein
MKQASLHLKDPAGPTMTNINTIFMAKVIDVFPEQNYIDVLRPNGGVIRKVEVLATAATSRSGIIDYPKISYSREAELVPNTSIDPISELGSTSTDGIRPRVSSTGLDVEGEINAYALIGFMEGCIELPVCFGFLYSPRTEMQFPVNHRIDRHHSDIYELIDSDGNYEHVFPDGTFVRIGQGTTRTNLIAQDTNKKWITKADDEATQDTAKTVHIEHTSGTSFTITPAGDVNVTVAKDKNITIVGDNTETVTGDNTINNLADYNVTTTGNKEEVVNGEDDLIVAGNKDDVILGNKTETVTGSSTETITGDKTIISEIMNIQAATLNLVIASQILTMTNGVINAETYSINATLLQIIGGVTNITSTNVNLGFTPTFSAVLGELLEIAFNTHVHSTTGPNTGVPTAPLTGVTSNTIKLSV